MLETSKNQSQASTSESIILNESVINTAGLKRNVCEILTVDRWSVDEIVALFELPFSDLINQAQTVHRANFDPNAVQVSTLLSIKTGGCSEDCGYCPQAARYHTEVEAEPLMKLDEVLAAAQEAKDNGASRFVWVLLGVAQNSAISNLY